MTIAQNAAQAEWLTALSLVLNTLQTLALAVIADRSRRVRATDRQGASERRSRAEVTHELHDAAGADEPAPRARRRRPRGST